MVPAAILACSTDLLNRLAGASANDANNPAPRSVGAARGAAPSARAVDGCGAGVVIALAAPASTATAAGDRVRASPAGPAGGAEGTAFGSAWAVWSSSAA